MPDPAREFVWELDSIDAQRAAADRPYEEFLSVPDLSAGLYALDVGATDGQTPHGEDEIYYVVSGSGQITVNGVTRDVVRGSIVFVAAHEPHRFHGISERLVLLVAFGPAEGSRG